MDEAVASGEPLATRATINAFAATSASNDANFSSQLFDATSCSGVLRRGGFINGEARYDCQGLRTRRSQDDVEVVGPTQDEVAADSFQFYSVHYSRWMRHSLVVLA